MWGQTTCDERKQKKNKNAQASTKNKRGVHREETWLGAVPSFAICNGCVLAFLLPVQRESFFPAGAVSVAVPPAEPSPNVSLNLSARTLAPLHLFLLLCTLTARVGNLALAAAALILL